MLSKTQEILTNHFGNSSVELIDKQGIFRCQREFNSNPYQILYVDCSGNWIKPNFDLSTLEKYQEAVLLKDYYTQSGSLQWNFYYAFISHEKEIDKFSIRKKAIETDELYSRKFVLSNLELDRWLRGLENLSKPSLKILEKDLSSIWIDKLRAAKLDSIFLDTTYVAGVDAILQGKPITEPKTSKRESVKDEGPVNLNHLKKLTLTKYRPYPLGSPFEFGRVNLIKGSNGCGKTSLFEAIELLYCGQTLRNPLENVSDMVISGDFDGQPWTFNPNINKLYKKRDQVWYSNSISRGHNLQAGFNKYNFYNSDAAYELVRNNDEASVVKAFEDIALGQEVNRIEEKLKGFKERLQSSSKQYAATIKRCDNELAQEKRLVADLTKKDGNPELFWGEVMSELKLLKWNINSDGAVVKYIPRITKGIVDIRSYLNSINENLQWLKKITKGNVEELFERYIKSEEMIVRADRQKEELINFLEDLEIDLENLQEGLVLTERLVSYIMETRINELLQLEKNINSKKEELKILKEIEKLDTAINYELLDNSITKLSLREASALLNSKIRDSQQAYTKATNQRQTIENSVNELEQVVSEIRTRGIQFLKLKPDAMKCPLCQSDHIKGKLAQLIVTPVIDINIPHAYQELDARLSQLKKDEKKISEQFKELNKCKTLSSLLYKDEVIKSILKIKDDANKKKLLIARVEEEYKDLVNLKSTFDAKGLKAEEYASLTRSLSKYKILVPTAKSYTKVKAKIEKDIAICQGKIQKTNTQIEKVEAELEEIYNFLKIKGEDRGEIFDSRLTQLEESKSDFERISVLVAISPDTTVSSIGKSVERLNDLLNEYKRLKSIKEEQDSRLSIASSKIKKLNAELEASKVFQARAEQALKSIDEVLIKNSKANYLKEFIDNNKQEIAEIFKVIHSPKEFDGLVFSTSDNESQIMLKRQGQMKWSSLFEISTGQRAALAISVFSALNRKLRNGPSILMFDDPVANIDDLNILSFFDYLREVAINGDRQIFFATPNENVAFFFKQKFEFLKDDFKVIDLSR